MPFLSRVRLCTELSFIPGLITLMFMFATVSITCGYHLDVGILVVPVATLFTITQLRDSMPGAPAGFGTPTPLLLYTTLFNSDVHRTDQVLLLVSSIFCWLVEFNLDIPCVLDYVGLLPCLALVSISVRRFHTAASKVSLHCSYRRPSPSELWFLRIQMSAIFLCGRECVSPSFVEDNVWCNTYYFTLVGSSNKKPTDEEKRMGMSEK